MVYLHQLAEHNLHPDAIRFLAFALPKRQAIWWACICTRIAHAALESIKPEQSEALAAAEAWVYKPNEENRRKAGLKSDQTDRQYPADWTAAAAFWSGGSISPAGQPGVEPPDHLAPHAVAGAILLAAATDDSEALNQHYRDFLARGIDIARGGKGFEPGQVQP